MGGRSDQASVAAAFGARRRPCRLGGRKLLSEGFPRRRPWTMLLPKDNCRIPVDNELLSTEALAGVLEAVGLLASLFPLQDEYGVDELDVPWALVDRLQARVSDVGDAVTPAAGELDDQLVLRLRLALNDEHTAEVEIAFPLRSDPACVIGPGGGPSSRVRAREDERSRTPPPTVTLIQPAWLQNAAFERLKSELLPQSETSLDDEPTTVVLDFVQRLQDKALVFLPAPSVASTRSSLDGSVEDAAAAIGLSDLSLTDSMSRELLICVSKMHRSSKTIACRRHLMQR
jgi:hypothetical protein